MKHHMITASGGSYQDGERSNFSYHVKCSCGYKGTANVAGLEAEQAIKFRNATMGRADDYGAMTGLAEMFCPVAQLEARVVKLEAIVACQGRELSALSTGEPVYG